MTVAARPGEYRAPAWLPGGHLQTIYPLAIAGRGPALSRERWTTPDEDFIDLDWLPGPAGAPLVVLFHGLEGSSKSHYATSLMRALKARGWRGVVVHFRGCSGEPNRLPRAYHSGDAPEIDWILRRLRAGHDAPVFVVGVSLGGNALLKWAGSFDTAGVVDAVCAVSAPLDVEAAGRAMSRRGNAIYRRNFLSSMKPVALEKHRRFPGLFDIERVMAARDLFEFDDAFTAPLHGFDGVLDFWRKVSSKPGLVNIRVPALVLNARNDPFLPAGALPRADEVSAAVVLEQPAQGGHVGFAGGRFPGHIDWLPQRVLRFFEHGI